MESVNERPLLYYVSWRTLPKHFYGAPIYHFLFKDVKTGEEINLGSCFFNEELSEVVGYEYYEDIENAVNDFDILWKLTDDKTNKLDVTFEEVQKEYQRMVGEGISPEEINTAMMNFYGVEPIVRKL